MNHNLNETECIIHRSICVIKQFLIHFILILHSSDLNLSQLRNKINYNFGTTGYRLKIQKAKFVTIEFPIELSNIYLTKFFFCRTMLAKVSLS